MIHPSAYSGRVLLVSIGLVLICTTALAGPRLSRQDAEQRGKALQVFKQGKTAYKAKDYDAALKFFRQAQAIYSHETLIILALAKTLDRAKQLEQAKRYYRLFLKEAPANDRSRAKTLQRIQAIDRLLAKRPATLVIRNLPTAARLRVNDKDAVPNAKGELSLPPGRYKVHADLQHHYPFDRAGISLKAGERLELPIVLKRIPDPSTLPRDHTWTWVAGTATGVSVLVTGVFALQSFFKRNEFFELADAGGAPTEKGRRDYDCEPQNPGDPKPLECPKWEAAVSEIKADAEGYQTAAAVSGLVAAGLGVATAVAYFAAPVKKGAAPRTSLLIAPTGPRSVGLTLRF